MGQPLPLPKRIPTPTNNKQQKKFDDYNIKILYPEEEFSRYELPKDWKLIDNSWREDLPEWYIMNENKLAVVMISGTWKETYDNDLRLTVFDEPKEIELRKNDIIPSGTAESALVGKFCEVIDPMHRPAEKRYVQRKD